MNKISKRTFALSLLASATGLALANTDTSTRDGATAQRHGHERWLQRRQQQLEQLREKLALSPQQEAAWERYKTVLAPSERPARGWKRDGGKTLTTPERLDHMLERSARRQQHMQQRADAIREFYAQLTPEQQKTFDQHSMPPRHHGQRRKHRRPSSGES